jgi:hypothetical protein
MRSSAPPLATNGPAEARDLTTLLCAAWVNARVSSGVSCFSVGKKRKDERTVESGKLELLKQSTDLNVLPQKRYLGD